MAGLGDTSLNKDKKAINMFLSSPGKQSTTTADSTFRHQKGIKLSDRQDVNLSDLKVALGTENDSEAIRWALDKIFELKGDEIREIAEKKRSMSLS